MRSVAFSCGGKASKLPAMQAASHAKPFAKSSYAHVSLAATRQVSACAAGCLSAAEVSRTITALVNYGTLSTVNADGLPLGTYVTFVLDSQGCPILRLRADAVHTANVASNPRCTLFAHPAERPARELARVTLIGSVEAVSEEEAAEAAARHAIIYGSCIGVDAPQSDDVFMRLNVHECFYVAGLGEPTAETISAADYATAQADELKDQAARLVHLYNTERIEDVLRIAASQMGVEFEQMHTAEFVWIDVRGVYLRGETVDGTSKSMRFEFPRAALDDMDALSLITMAAQAAWEAERAYTPSMPETVERSEA